VSFFKSEWSFDDYPVSFTRPIPDNVKSGTVPADTWIVGVDGWPGMVEMASSKTEALHRLQDRFREYVQSGEKLPRPGTQQKLEVACSEGIEKYDNLLPSFLKEIMDFDPNELVFVSDESSLWDFAEGDTLEPYFAKIQERYEIDVSDIENGNLLEILTRIGNSTTNNRLQ